MTAQGWLEVDDIVHKQEYDESYGKSACLGDPDLSDLSAPIADVRAYLTARYQRRFTLHPRLFEKTVASVFADHGYAATVTAYSGEALTSSLSVAQKLSECSSNGMGN